MRETFFQRLGYDCFALRHNTTSNEVLVRKEVQVELAGRKLLEKSGENGLLNFSWWRTYEDSS